MTRDPDGPKFCKACPNVYACGGNECAAMAAILDAWRSMSPALSDALNAAEKCNPAQTACFRCDNNVLKCDGMFAGAPSSCTRAR